MIEQYYNHTKLTLLLKEQKKNLTLSMIGITIFMIVHVLNDMICMKILIVAILVMIFE